MVLWSDVTRVICISYMLKRSGSLGTRLGDFTYVLAYDMVTEILLTGFQGFPWMISDTHENLIRL